MTRCGRFVKPRSLTAAQRRSALSALSFLGSHENFGACLIRGFIFLCVVVLAALGVPIARKFLRGLIHGADLYVVFETNGKTVVIKNPGRSGLEDPPLEVVPTEIFTSDHYETYYNVCWFDTIGTLHRCVHRYHRTVENAAYCKENGTEHSFIGKVLEER
jgi:hypothetical protein